MRTIALLLANHAQVDSDNKLNLLGAGFDRFTVAELPASVQQPFYVVVKADFEREQAGTGVPLRLRIVDPEGNELPQPQADGVIVPTLADDPDLPASGGAIICVQHCLFEQAGTYKVRFQLGDLPPEDLPIKVQLGVIQPR